MKWPAFLGVLLVVCVNRSGAQQWQPGSSIELIQRAAAHRAARDADTLLSSWQAEAHGILRFASVLDHGDGPVERVIKADELRIEVYGESPNQSKQLIQAWRDTSFLPNQLIYHRDHLGIVANDFGPVIRLGQGEEVRDVLHPLSVPGLHQYLFALGDTVTLTAPTGRVRVIAVQVKPLNGGSAGAVGTLYLDLDRAVLVSFRFTFTPSSYRDASVEEITVTLENSLQQNARWLPWRQSIMIRRGIPAIELPFRTVIRGEWTIENYQLGVHHPADRFAGPFLAGPRAATGAGDWAGPIAQLLDSLPATAGDADLIERDASRSMGGQLLDGLPRLRLLGSGLSDLLRVNRVEGVTPALGGRLAVGGAWVARGRIGLGLSDRRAIGSFALDHMAGRAVWSIAAGRIVSDIGDDPVTSGLANSIGTAISGADFGDYALITSLGLGYNATRGDLHIRVGIGKESVRSVSTRFTPLDASAEPNPALGRPGESWVGRASISQRNRGGGAWLLAAEAGSGNGEWQRARGAANTTVALPSSELLLSGAAGIAWGDVPEYRSFVLGGRGTLLGVPFRSLGGTRMARAEVAWRLPISLPSPPFPYSRWVKLSSTIAPYVAAGTAGGDMSTVPWRGTGRIETVAGLRLDLWGPLLRVETGVSLRTGRASVSIDVHPDWWGVM